MSWKLVAGLMVLFVSGAGAPTYVRAAELDSFRDANAALRNGLENGKPPPNMSDPAYAEQVSLAFNLAITEIARGKSISDILEICNEANKTDVQYMLFGVKQEIDHIPEAEKVTRTLQVANKNLIRFQDEVTAAVHFNIVCTARMAEQSDAFFSQLKLSELTPTRRAGAQQLQNGLVQVVSGVALSQLDDIRADNRKIMLDALILNARSITAVMTLKGRGAALANVDKVMASPSISSDAREKLGEMEIILKRTDCGPSCSFE